MKIKYCILPLLLFCTSFLFAQDAKFTVSVSQTQVGVGEQFEVTFSVNGNGNHFTPPDLSTFQVFSGPNVSTSMMSVNGTTTVSTAYSYGMIAVREGEFTIGPASIVVDGHSLRTNAVKIRVVQGQAPQQARRNQRQMPPDNTVPAGNAGDISKSLFMRAVVDKSTVYPGEQITLSYKIYTRVDIEQSQVDKLPDLNGFFNEDIKNPQQGHLRQETYQGARYNVADLKQTILFPEHTGDLIIDPLAMTFLVREQVSGGSGDVFDQLFGSYREAKYQVKSKPVIIHVKPLPENGKPDSFTGAVGSFSINASVDKTDLKANDAINYKVKVTGAGNIKLLKTLNTNFPADFEKYDPKITDTITETENGVAGSRIYNYLLIPRHQGDYTIEPVKFSYFNPATGRYVSLSSKSFRIQVAKGLNESNVTSLATDKQDVKMLGKDIRYIKAEGDSLRGQGDAFFGSIGYYLLLLLGPVLAYTAYLYRNWLVKNNADIVKVKNRRAGKVAAKHLANAQKQLTANNTKVFYEDVFKGLYGYLSDKLNISYANLDRETIVSALKERSLKEQLTTQLLDTLDLCEMARYAPVTHISAQQVF